MCVKTTFKLQKTQTVKKKLKGTSQQKYRSAVTKPKKSLNMQNHNHVKNKQIHRPEKIKDRSCSLIKVLIL